MSNASPPNRVLPAVAFTCTEEQVVSAITPCARQPKSIHASHAAYIVL